VHELPSGTVTFLFTDIEGSTRLLHELGDAYADVLAEHRRVLRDAFTRHGGAEVDTQGDAFFVAFASAGDALAAAADAQRRLAGSQVRVRMGVHTGEPLLTDEGYVGVDVHRAARIASAGHGGQVLVSQSTRELASGDGLRDLGEHRLKDFTEPERLWQLGEGAFPPLATRAQTNLPRPSEPLVGRKKELADVLGLLRRDAARLVTVTGPGGVGKTRFTLEVAHELSGAHERGAWLVDLSPVNESEFVLPAIAGALGAADDVADHIRDDELLLVLDNFEHVIDAAQDVADMLDRCARLVLLVTSREPLQLTAEREYALRPLAESPAVELFRQRAEAARPGFDADYSLIAEICRRLDALPLALELAAARVNALSAEDLLDRLERRLPLLVARARDVPARQRTLRAAIEWSYDLLSPTEQSLLTRLAVFSGGWTFAAAEAVCGGELELVDSLLAKSLIRFDGERYSMLETIHEFARERFDASQDADETRGRHARYYPDLAERAEPELTGPRQAQWVAMLAEEGDNLRAALAFAESNAPGEALRLASALVIFWYLRSLYGVGVGWLERTLAAAPGDDEARTRALWGLGFLRALAGALGDVRAPLEEGLALAYAVGDDVTIGRSHDVLGMLAFFTDDAVEARAGFEKAVVHARGANDMWCLADALGTLASIYPLQGEIELAETVGREGLAIARRNRDEHGIRMSLFGLALTASRRGDHVSAREHASEGLAVSRELGDLWFTSYFLWLLADASLQAGDLSRALAEADESVAVAQRIESALLVVCGLEVRARVRLEAGDRAAAIADLDEGLVIAERGGVPKSYRATALATRAAVFLDDGQPSEAHALLEQAERLAGDVHDRFVVERAHALRGSL
jgi:predicted ATPase/class 3 adenylate cyclase